MIEKNILKILAKSGNEKVATVYVAEINNKKIEFVEAVQPPLKREQKWVLIISSLFGCPVKCAFCDAGGYYQGKLTEDELIAQIDFLIKNRFPDKVVKSDKFKIQFARVGEPAFNENILYVLEKLPSLYKMPSFIPSISTVAPIGTEDFFFKLLEIKNRLYKNSFQLQFSIHNTDEKLRDEIIPVKKWNFEQINEYGEKFYSKGDKNEKKITLNFAIQDQKAIDIDILKKYFDPEIFLIKITPINPTYKAISNNMATSLDIKFLTENLIANLNKAGFQTILSIGELEENNIGSNCGQYISNLNQKIIKQIDSYNYELIKIKG